MVALSTLLLTVGLYTFSGSSVYAQTTVSAATVSAYSKGQNTQGYYPTKTTFSIPTAVTANPVASGISIDNGTAYINYSTVGGFFLQDLNSTNQTTFDYAATNFGLLNRTYPGESSSDQARPQWARFNRYLDRLNHRAPKDTSYKLLFLARHGEGYHNAAQTYYGTPAWNCYWGEANGNSTTNWSDAALTPAGIAQAIKANLFWTTLITSQQITPPQSFYTSPLTRCLQTANNTWANLTALGVPYTPRVKELIREGISIHTCDRRSALSLLKSTWPSYAFEPSMTENDTLWNGVSAESASAQAYRSQVAMDQIFSEDREQVLSFTSHSGEIASILTVLGHIPFALSTGQVLPVLVRAVTVRERPVSVTTSDWATSAWCTNAPPVTSAVACVCQSGVAPTAVAPGLVFTTNPAKR